MIQDILHVDREHIWVKESIGVIAVIVIASLFEVLFGEVALYAIIAAYFVYRVGVGSHKQGRQRWLYMVAATVLGTALSVLALLVGDNTLQAVLLWSGFIYLCGLAAAYGKAAFYTGYFLVAWLLVAMLTASRSPEEPIYYAVGFLLGGAIAMIIMAIGVRFGWVDDTKIEATNTPVPTIAEAAKSNIGVFAILWALTMAIAILLGYTFWSVEPFWVATTILVVMQPDVSQGFKKGFQRGIGSAIGGVLVFALIGAFPDFTTSNLFIFYFFAATALCVMFYKANYMIYAFFMTQALVLYYGLAVGNFTEVDGQRLLGVLFGVLISFIGLAVQHLIIESRKKQTKT